MITKIIVFVLAIVLSWSITFPLSNSRQTCFHIKQKGVYQIEFIVSGNQPTQYACLIYSNSSILYNISELTEYQKTIEFPTENNNKICFISKDNQMKQVSFDIMSTEDPLKNHFSVKQQEQTHIKMFNAFQQLEKVYRDQHMFIERSLIYQNILANKELKIILVLLFKIIVAVILGAYQLMLIKDIVTNKTYGFSLPPGLQDDSSSEDNEDQNKQ